MDDPQLSAPAGSLGTRPSAARILHVEDEPHLRASFATLITRRGFLVDSAASGVDALRMASQRNYAVIVVDIRMPGVDGVTLIGELKVLQPAAVFLVLSGSSQSELDRARAEPAVAAAISKPCPPDDLEAHLRRALALYEERMTGNASGFEVGRALKVLLVDENDAESAKLVVLLDGTNSEFSRARSLREAADALARAQFDAILVDAGISGGRDLDGVRELQTLAPDAAVVVLTDLADDAAALSVLRLGAQDYLTKGEIDPRSLRRSLVYALERKRAERRLRYLARSDLLTGLANRATLLERLEQSLSRATRERGRLALLMIDLDGFKQVNDSLGHPAGDCLLQEIAARFRRTLRPYDLVARLGGDEFAVLAEGLADEGAVAAVAGRLLRAASEPVMLENTEVTISASIGAAGFPEAGSTAEELLRKADVAMYEAKKNGRARVAVFSSEQEQAVRDKVALLGELRKAVKAEAFELHYQPQVLLGSSRVVGLEALVRWRKSPEVLVPPLQFIPLLEETGLIVEVGAWVLMAACRQLAAWRKLGFNDLRIAVNLSARQLEDDIVAAVRQSLLETGVPGPSLELEITESLLMKDPKRAAQVLTELKTLGVRLAVDDFGTGYSSLAYLSRFDVDVLKIDRSFVRGMIEDRKSASVANGIVSLGHQLDMEVVAEGVETNDQALRLHAAGCDMAQGFYFGKPVALWRPDTIIEPLQLKIA